jgi:hypothetical protein
MKPQSCLKNRRYRPLLSWWLTTTGGRRVGTSRPMTRSGSYSTASAARTPWQICSARKASPNACITCGRRNIETPTNAAWRATRPVPRVRCLRREASALKDCAADLTLENRLPKKHDCGWGGQRMRCPSSEKLEVISIVEQSHLSAKRTLIQLGIPRRPSATSMIAISSAAPKR